MGFELSQVPSRLETVNKFMERMKSATEEAKSAIHKAQEDMTQYYNQRRTPAPVYKPGDRVYIRGHLGWCLVSIEGLFY